MAYEDILGTFLVGGFFVFFIILALAVYVYTAWAIMVIAQKLNHPYPWLAWIPLANVALLFSLGAFPWWLVFGYVLLWIPFLGAIIGVALAVIGIIAWWRIAEKMNRPGWWGLIIGLVPILQWIWLGMLAWGDNK